MRAPAAAPIAVPIAALATPLSTADWLAVLPPTWYEANWRQSTSSALNWSKDLPVPGSTSTLGPSGTLAQPASSTAAAAPVYLSHAGMFTIVPFMKEEGAYRGGCAGTRSQLPPGHSLTYG